MKRPSTLNSLLCVACLSCCAPQNDVFAEAGGKDSVGVVSNIKVVSNHVADVSSIEAWRASFIKPGMTDREKALAVWDTVVRYRHQDTPPLEYLHEDLCVHDPIKSFNVYGYGQCCCSASNIEGLARAVGLNTRGRELKGHTVPEVEWKQDWHMLDASLVCYFTDASGDVASVNEVAKDVRTWLTANPGQRSRLRSFMQDDGWKKGPGLLASSRFYDRNGRLPALSHGWHSTMGEYSGYPPVREQGYSMGYRVNVQLRPGETLVRNWSNKGLNVNLDASGKGASPLCQGGAYLAYARKFGDLAPGRVGNGRREWNVPLGDPALKQSALRHENLSVPASAADPASLTLADAASTGILELRMPTSYVYLGGALKVSGEAGNSGKLRISISRNHGADWKEIFTASDSQFSETVELRSFIHRLYDYRVRFELTGTGTRLTSVSLEHDIQHSQRALPALAQGDNQISFSAGPAHGTLTIEGNTRTTHPQILNVREFHPQFDQVVSNQYGMVMKGGNGSITFPIETPGDITRLHFGCHYRARSAKDGWNLDVSWDAGKTWQTLDRAGGPVVGSCKYAATDKVPVETRKALVRFTGRQNNTAMLFSLRIDADYAEPGGGFRPVRTTYQWLEDGKNTQHTHVAESPEETYVIRCKGKPTMQALTVELAN